MFDIFHKNRDKVVIDYLKRGAFLVDVRTPEEFAEGTAGDAINIPLQVLHENLDAFKGKEPIVVFCRSGNRSGQAKLILESEGFTEVENGGGCHHMIHLVEKAAEE